MPRRGKSKSIAKMFGQGRLLNASPSFGLVYDKLFYFLVGSDKANSMLCMSPSMGDWWEEHAQASWESKTAWDVPFTVDPRLGPEMRIGALNLFKEPLLLTFLG